MENNVIKVEKFYNKNQFLLKGEEKTIFQSYSSTIALYQNGILTLGQDWDYSRTTTKHLYLFISDYVNNTEIEEVENKSNKRAYIQKLIDNGVILYNENM